MTELEKAARMALEALEFIPESGSMLGAQAEAKRLEAITVLRQALEQQARQGCDYCNHQQYAGTKCKNCGRGQPTQQEPVAWIFKPNMELLWPDEIEVQNPFGHAGYKPLYTRPQARAWVGLTDDEFEDIEMGCRSTPSGKIEAMKQVEAKLKEKNT